MGAGKSKEAAGSDAAGAGARRSSGSSSKQQQQPPATATAEQQQSQKQVQPEKVSSEALPAAGPEAASAAPATRAAADAPIATPVLVPAPAPALALAPIADADLPADAGGELPEVDLAADVPEGTQQEAYDHWNQIAPPEAASSASASSSAVSAATTAPAPATPVAPPTPSSATAGSSTGAGVVSPTGGLKRNASMRPPGQSAGTGGAPAAGGAPRPGTIRLQKTMRDTMRATPCAGDLRLLVKLPPHADMNEWVALNTIHFYRATRMIYDSYRHICTDQSCPLMAAGSFEYLWKDSGAYPRPTRVPARAYISFVLDEALATIDDQSVFPIHEDQDFPPNFIARVKDMYKRMFRMFAHYYYSHYEQIKALGSNRHLNSSFKHFILFALEFSLIDAPTMEPLKQFVDHIVAAPAPSSGR